MHKSGVVSVLRRCHEGCLQGRRRCLRGDHGTLATMKDLWDTLGYRNLLGGLDHFWRDQICFPWFSMNGSTKTLNRGAPGQTWKSWKRGPGKEDCIGNHHPNRRIFFRGVETTHQVMENRHPFLWSLFWTPCDSIGFLDHLLRHPRSSKIIQDADEAVFDSRVALLIEKLAAVPESKIVGSPESVVFSGICVVLPDFTSDAIICNIL